MATRQLTRTCAPNPAHLVGGSLFDFGLKNLLVRQSALPAFFYRSNRVLAWLMFVYEFLLRAQSRDSAFDFDQAEMPDRASTTARYYCQNQGNVSTAQ
jgi:hypothetical protein